MNFTVLDQIIVDGVSCEIRLVPNNQGLNYEIVSKGTNTLPGRLQEAVISIVDGRYNVVVDKFRIHFVIWNGSLESGYEVFHAVESVEMLAADISRLIIAILDTY
jgi:hypothetical protein